MTSSAEFSADRLYRYNLIRIWNETSGSVMFIGLNPSNADEVKNDPTIHKCMRYAKSGGYGGIMMTNLFAFVSTKPEMMKNAREPVGPDNDDAIRIGASRAKFVVAVWGDQGSFQARGDKVRGMIKNLHALKISKSGHPRHPRFLKGDLMPFPWL